MKITANNFLVGELSMINIKKGEIYILIDTVRQLID